MSDRDDGTEANEHEAVEALERLGLSNYAARVFVALQRLGVGTAKQIHEETDVPRSQVYGAAEELERLGLVELQQSTPKRYRPVSLDAARRSLAENLQSEADRAFDYLEAAREQRTAGETRDDVWTVRGREPVTNRVVELAEQAQRRVLFGAPSDEFVSEAFVKALSAAVAADVDVTVISEDPDLRARFEGAPGVDVAEPAEDPVAAFSGRLLLVDERAVLLSVVSETGGEETAIWSADTEMAAILSRIIQGAVESMVRD